MSVGGETPHHAATTSTVSHVAMARGMERPTWVQGLAIAIATVLVPLVGFMMLRKRRRAQRVVRVTAIR